MMKMGFMEVLCGIIIRRDCRCDSYDNFRLWRDKMETIFLIPAEGDGPETMQWYIKALRATRDVKVIVFDHAALEGSNDWSGLGLKVHRVLDSLVAEHGGELVAAEVHAQGGFGAYVAVALLERFPGLVKRVFFIGGAPSDAMTLVAKWFHRSFSRVWYYLPVPFFADDPNPTSDPRIVAIKKSSTDFMRKYPKLYMCQLVMMSYWGLPQGSIAPCEAYFVPNGDTVRPKWWDNTYNHERAAEIWQKYGVTTTRKPGGNFSFYSMMPAEELFNVMDEVRWIDL